MTPRSANPKSEGRNPNQIRKPKFATATSGISGAVKTNADKGRSDFGLRVSIGFRISIFGLSRLKFAQVHNGRTAVRLLRNRLTACLTTHFDFSNAASAAG